MGVWLAAEASFSTATSWSPSYSGWMKISVTSMLVPPELSWLVPSRTWTGDESTRLSTSSTMGTPSRPPMQCAAVTTVCASTREPPQYWLEPSPDVMAAIQGYSPSAAKPPPTMAEAGGGAKASRNSRVPRTGSARRAMDRPGG